MHVRSTTRHVESGHPHLVVDISTHGIKSEQPSVLTGAPLTSAIANLVAFSKEATSGSNGHRVDHQHQGYGSGVVYTTPTLPPVTGAIVHPHPLLVDVKHYDQSDYNHVPPYFPPLEFPQFDRSSPKIWIRRYESSFDVYSVPRSMWVNLATMQFIGSASFWLQTVLIEMSIIT